MTTIFAAICLMAFLMLAMAVGVIFQGKALKGSCGGIGGECLCLDAGQQGACAIKGRKYDADERPNMSARQADDGVLLYE